MLPIAEAQKLLGKSDLIFCLCFLGGLVGVVMEGGCEGFSKYFLSDYH